MTLWIWCIYLINYLFFYNIFFNYKFYIFLMDEIVNVPDDYVAPYF